MHGSWAQAPHGRPTSLPWNASTRVPMTAPAGRSSCWCSPARPEVGCRFAGRPVRAGSGVAGPRL